MIIPEQNILLIEDDLDINEAIQSILKDENFNVDAVFNGKEALEYLKNSHHNPSLILIDLMMPLMNGLQFREAQLQDPRIANIPTVMLSASNNFEDINKLKFQGYLPKPLDLDTLINIVRKFIKL